MGILRSDLWMVEGNQRGRQGKGACQRQEVYLKPNDKTESVHPHPSGHQPVKTMLFLPQLPVFVLSRQTRGSHTFPTPAGCNGGLWSGKKVHSHRIPYLGGGLVVWFGLVGVFWLFGLRQGLVQPKLALNLFCSLH